MAQIVSVAAQAREGRVIGDAGFKASLWPFAGAGEADFLPLVRKAISMSHSRSWITFYCPCLPL